jgi:hypothetical protein
MRDEEKETEKLNNDLRFFFGWCNLTWIKYCRLTKISCHRIIH